MGLQNQFNDIIHDQLSVYAAWLPVTNTFALGDYGVFNEGIFTKIGNISEFGIQFESAFGPDAVLDFTSKDTIVTKTDVSAQATVSAQVSGKAAVTFNFTKDRSFLLKVPVIKVNQMQNINQVAEQLKGKDKWELRFKVVSQTYTGQDALLVSNITAGTELTFNVDVTVLQVVQDASASLQMTTTKALGLNITGKTGIIGLGLFKLNWLTKKLETLEVELDEEKPSAKSEALPLVAVLKPSKSDNDL